MMRYLKVILIAGSVITLIGVGLLWSRKRERIIMSDRVADEGYETAYDILYPDKGKNNGKLHFGPVH